MEQIIVPTIEDLYKYFGVLADAKEDAGKHVDIYLKIMSGTKGGVKEKQLSSQFITRFFKHFPKEMAISIDAIFDLCEDEDITIRKSAIKDLSLLCKDCTAEHLKRIADILTQLLQTDDQHEFTQVQTSLLTVLKQDPKSTLNEIFNQINMAELEEVRKRAIKFLVAKIPAMLEHTDDGEAKNSIVTKEIEELIVKNVKQVLMDVDAEEFILLIKLLASLPSMSTLQGRQDLVNIIMSQSELDKPFEANDTERLMILLSCIQQALPLFSKNVQSNKYVKSYLDNVLCVFKKLDDEATKFELLKAFAELCSHFNGSSAISSPITATELKTVYDLLVEYLPKPAETNEQERSSEESDDAKFNFSYVECLMYSFHILARLNPDFLSSEANKEMLKDFRLRLQYFAKGTLNYIKELRSSLSKPINVYNKQENEEVKIRRVALKVTTNIDSMIRDLFHNPPSYKTNIVLSWKQMEQQQANANNSPMPAKRSLSETNSDSNGDNSKKKPERGIYHPPSGKYSVNSNNFNSNNGINSNANNGHSNGKSGFQRRPRSGPYQQRYQRY